MNDASKAAILAKLDEAERALRAARALFAEPPRTKAYEVEHAIMAALASCDAPLSMIEVTSATGLDYTDVGLALTRLYRAGRVTRERIRRDGTHRLFYVYRSAVKHAIQ